MKATENSNKPEDPLQLEMNNFLVKIAATESEKNAAKRLRFEVFNQEMNEGLSISWDTGLDEDQYDEHADHLLVIDSKNNRVVGTYRMLIKSRVIKNGGFYSEEEFDLSNLKRLPVELLEMGRSCVHKDYRSGQVLNLLWSGIAKYLKLNNAKFLFGCASLHTHDVDEVSEIYTYLKSKFYADEKYRVYPVQKCSVAGLKDDVDISDPRLIKKKIPALLKGYLRMGAQICGEPAFDGEFGTTDFFILLPTDKLTRRYHERYINERDND